MVYSGKTRFTMTKIKQKNKQQIKKKIDKIILRMVSDKSHISYWDGCVPELMEVIEEDRKQQRKELIEEIKEESRKEIIEIIGRKEEEPKTYWIDWGIRIRNKLRKEQRRKGGLE